MRWKLWLGSDRSSACGLVIGARGEAGDASCWGRLEWERRSRRARGGYVYGDIGNRDMCVCVLQVFCAPAVETHAGEDSLESRQESCCGRGDDESTIRRVMGRRQAAAGELAGMLVCNGDDDGGSGREAEASRAGQLIIIARGRWAKWQCACDGVGLAVEFV